MEVGGGGEDVEVGEVRESCEVGEGCEYVEGGEARRLQVWEGE